MTTHTHRDPETLDPGGQMTHTHTDPETTHRDPETLTDAIGLVRVCLGLDPETGTDPADPDRDPLTLDCIPGDARFTLRRDVEYLAEEDCHPDYAAPAGSLDRALIWQRTGDDETLDSDWSGSDQMVRAYRWDLFGLTLEDLQYLAEINIWSPSDAETLGGYLDWDGIHPSCQILSDGMDWHIGGWSPVYLVADYVILD